MESQFFKITTVERKFLITDEISDTNFLRVKSLIKKGLWLTTTNLMFQLVLQILELHQHSKPQILKCTKRIKKHFAKTNINVSAMLPFIHNHQSSFSASPTQKPLSMTKLSGDKDILVPSLPEFELYFIFIQPFYTEAT